MSFNTLGPWLPGTQQAERVTTIGMEKNMEQKLKESETCYTDQ